MSHLHTCPFKAGIARDLCSAACGFAACTGKTEPAGPVIGSLFSGYGGLERGVQAVLGGRVAWHVENGTAPSKILEHNHPGVPNYGDVAAVDWRAVEPVDVLTAGFPCQDLTKVGRRRGLRPDTRSGLWAHVVYAITQLRPPLVVIENVRGLASAEAHSDVEPCPWCVGDVADGISMRALGAVLSDLADLGYDARWCGLRASDVGAPHERERLWIVATPADADGNAAGLGPRGVGSDAPKERRVGPTDDGDARRGAPLLESRETGAHLDTWREYAPLIERWERVTGHKAPELDAPLDLISEWMMGLPPGHVTAVPGLSMSERLAALGNGVVPQQAAAALEWLLAIPA